MSHSTSRSYSISNYICGYKIDRKDISKIPLFDPLNCASVQNSEEIFSQDHGQNAILVFVFGDLRDPITRDYASQIDRYVLMFKEKYNIRTIGICSSFHGASKFLKNYWTNADLYADYEKSLYRCFSMKQAKKSSHLKLLLPSYVIKQCKSTLRTKTFIPRPTRDLGCVFIINNNMKCTYQYVQTSPGSFPSVHLILSACYRTDAMFQAEKKASEEYLSGSPDLNMNELYNNHDAYVDDILDRPKDHSILDIKKKLKHSGDFFEDRERSFL